MPVQKTKYFEVQAGHGRLFWEVLLGQPRSSFSNLTTHVSTKREPCAEKSLPAPLVWPAKGVFFDFLKKIVSGGASEREACAAKRPSMKALPLRDVPSKTSPKALPVGSASKGWPFQGVHEGSAFSFCL